MEAPMSMALAMALVKSAAEADPGFVRARPEFQSTSLSNGYAALESFFGRITDLIGKSGRCTQHGHCRDS